MSLPTAQQTGQGMCDMHGVAKHALDAYLQKGRFAQFITLTISVRADTAALLYK